MTCFADKLASRIGATGTPLIAGLDPVLEAIPECFRAPNTARTDEEHIFVSLTDFYRVALPPLASTVAAVKPNCAFFEQYGIGGIRALYWLRSACRDLDLPVILDAKRGDIGSTAEAYSAAYIGRPSVGGGYDADAITVNPFLGLETLEPFARDAETHGKGVFVLVRTSNPGSSALQSIGSPGGTAAERIADWIRSRGERLTGSSGYSGIGAVVGATYPDEARALRSRMPRAIFLVPGFGSQGAAASDAVAGFDDRRGGAIVNASRAIMSAFSSLSIDREAAAREIAQQARKLAADLRAALGE